MQPRLNMDTATFPAGRLSADELRRHVAQHNWYHVVDLGDGILTPGTYDLRPIVDQYGLPESLAGWSVLDVGPGHGFFSFEFERRGAASVTTAELAAWEEHDASPALKQEFERAGAARVQAGEVDRYLHGALGLAIYARQSQVQRRFCGIYDLTPERVGTHDLVFCASVLLHVTDPLRALYGLRRVTRRQAIICTGIDNTLEFVHQSRALFLGTVDGQAFWFPTMTCLEKMALAAGFRRVERVSTFTLSSVDGQFNTPHGTIRAFVD
jgi:tRNA (mo5U34)-methyltransferase